MRVDFRLAKTLAIGTFMIIFAGFINGQTTTDVDYSKFNGAWNPMQMAPVDEPNSFDVSFEDYDVLFEIDEKTGNGRMVNKMFGDVLMDYRIRIINSDSKSYIEIETGDGKAVCEILKLDDKVLLVKNDKEKMIWKWEKKE